MKANRFWTLSSMVLLAVCFASPIVFAQEAGGGESLIGRMARDAGVIGWVIVLVSIVALGLIIEYFVTIRRDKLAPPEVIDEIEALLEEGDYQEALELCEAEQNFFTNVVAAGLPKVNASFEHMSKALEEMTEEEAIRLHQKVGWLSLLGNVAPMMGLFGTVWGMTKAFYVIAESGGQANPTDLAEGISGALITTILGLFVAIPVTAFFVFFRNRVVRMTLEIAAIVEELFERFRPTKETMAA